MMGGITMSKGVGRRVLSVMMILLMLMGTMLVTGGSAAAAEAEKVTTTALDSADVSYEDETTEPANVEVEIEQGTIAYEVPDALVQADALEDSYAYSALNELSEDAQPEVASTDAAEAAKPDAEISVSAPKKDEVAALAAESEALATEYSDYAIRGTFTDWESNDAVAFASGSSTVIEAVYTIEAGQYKFKVYDMASATWYGNGGTIDDACSDWGFRTGKDSTIFNATGGVYKFTVNVADTSRLGVTIVRLGDIEEKTGVYVNGEFLEAQVGDVVTYTATLTAQELFENIQAYVSYDETKLTLVRKDQHPTLTEREIACPGLDGVFYPDVEGVVTFNASKVQGFDFKDGNILVTLDFQVTAEGESAVDLLIQEMAIKGEDGRSYFKGGEAVTTSGISVVETAEISGTATDPVEDANSGIHYAVTSEGEAQITYYTGSASELVIPSEIDGYTVTGIADYAFYDCTALTSVVLPETVTSVGAYAFYYCDALKTITIPASTTEIGKKAFAQDTALTDVYYGSTEAAWQEVAVAQENECLTNATIHYTEEEATPDEPTQPEETYYTVTFVDYDGRVIDTQSVKEGESATAPEAPQRTGYNFAGWDVDFENVSSNLTVTALYEKKPTPAAPTTGILKLEVSGGTGFTIAVDGGDAHPQGSVYHNSKMTIGTKVTVVANTTSDADFVCWINSATSVILSTDPEYTFTTSGNDFFKAMFSVEIEGVQMVSFKNDKASGGAGRMLEVQYYAAEDSIQFPDAPTQVGFDFAGWSMTEAEIKNAIANGEDVTVVALWTKALIPVEVTVNGGEGSGTYYANNAVTVTANEAEEGKKFAYWTDAEGNIRSYNAEYTFFPANDTTVTAVFVEEDTEIDYQILVSLDSIDTTTVEGKNVFTYSWYCPEQYSFVKAGIVAVNKDNYNEATFVAGSSDANVYDRSPSGDNLKPVNTFTWTKSNVASGQTWMAMAYVQYKDASGQVITVYSDVVEATKD